MKQFNINQYIRPDVAKMAPYVPGASAWDLARKYEQDIAKVVKLNTNENPYGPSPLVQKAVMKALFHYYPPSDYKNLRSALAEYTKMKKENIIVGAGSDEVIDLLLRVILEEGDNVIICPPTFGMYETYTRLNRGNVVNVRRNKDFSLNVEAILKQGTAEKIKIIFLCNPNSPTGNLTPQEDIIRILKTGKLVVVDEAYYEFSGQTATSLLKKYPNLIILRTLSKWAGLAGLRLGYGIMTPFLIEQILKIKPPYSISNTTEQAALATLKDLSFTNASIQKIVSERESMYQELKTIPTIQVYKSYGNFLFIQINEDDYTLLKDTFEKNKIALRYFPSINNGVRITIGKKQQNDKVLAVLKARKNKKKYAFLDRDGTLIFEPQDTYQIDSIEKLKILDGAIKGLKELIRQEYELIMISNQDGLGTSSFPQANFEASQNKMLSLFEKNGIKFSRIFICPHLPSKNCGCRKPKIGLVKKFLRNNQIDKNNSLVCGDRPTDKFFAKNIGLKFISMPTNGDFYEALMQGGVIV